MQPLNITRQTIGALSRLNAEQRAIVDAGIRRHIAACRKGGVNIEGMERVFVELIDGAIDGTITLQDFVGSKPTHLDYEQRRFESYTSPREL